MKAVITLNQLSIFSIVLLSSSVKSDYGSGQQESPGPSGPTPLASPGPENSTSTPSSNNSSTTGNFTNDITGQWYLVMANHCEGTGVMNLPCMCFVAYFRPLREDNWELYWSATNNQTNTLVTSTGGLQSSTSGSADFKGFILSRAEVPLSVICTGQDYTISESVHGCNGNTDQTLVWCRKKAPGKKTIWTKIVENLNSLSINPHDLGFVSQKDCKTPTSNQYDEMSFCS